MAVVGLLPLLGELHIIIQKPRAMPWAMSSLAFQAD